MTTTPDAALPEVLRLEIEGVLARLMLDLPPLKGETITAEIRTGIMHAICDALAAAERAAIEKCAKVCDHVADGGEIKTIGFIDKVAEPAAQYCAWEIRRLLPRPEPRGDAP